MHKQEGGEHAHSCVRVHVHVCVCKGERERFRERERELALLQKTIVLGTEDSSTSCRRADFLF